MQDFLSIAKIGKAVGLRGEVKFYVLTDFPEQFKTKDTIKLENGKILTFQKIDLEKEVVKFLEINSREDATEIVNQSVVSTFEESRDNCELGEDEFFWFDIIGCKIVENEKTLGKITDIERFGVQDYLVVETDEKLLESQKFSKSFLIPYIDKYILDVDLQNKTVKTVDSFYILESS